MDSSTEHEQAAPFERIDRYTPRITLELLELFAAAARAGSIAGGARQLHMVPSVATRKIAILEDALHCRLFDRTTRRIHLTQAGSVALEWAREVVAGHERLADEISTLQGELSGTLRLILNEYLCCVVLPPFLADFSKRHPQIQYNITMADGLVSAEQRDYDVAVHSGHVPDCNLTGVRIRSVRRVLCASPAYIARHGMPLKLEDLARHHCLVHHQHAGGSWVVKKDGRVIEQPIHQLTLANSYLPLIEFALNGMGIARVSAVSVRKELESGRLVQILPEFENVYADGESPAIWVLYPNRHMLQRTRVFVDELTSFLRQQ